MTDGSAWMWVIVLAVPGTMGALLWALDGLERRLVYPIQYAETIRKLLDKGSPDQIEIEVSRILAPVLTGPKHPTSTSASA